MALVDFSHAARSAERPSKGRESAAVVLPMSARAAEPVGSEPFRIGKIDRNESRRSCFQ
ncbi:hypothetical protein [Mesorhizobium sp. M0633]|uniref:hypothetical protein n=1 Tax=Mesorhizobium sp. M0633 TaxID=2956977 RepID=UPI00333A5A03